jgi:hypothetical protein
VRLIEFTGRCVTYRTSFARWTRQDAAKVSGAVNMGEAPMFHYRNFGHARKADLDAVNLARVSQGLEPHARPSHTVAVVTLLLVIAVLMVLVT